MAICSGYLGFTIQYVRDEQFMLSTSNPNVTLVSLSMTSI